jgi:hypothetical protein
MGARVLPEFRAVGLEVGTAKDTMRKLATLTCRRTAMRDTKILGLKAVALVGWCASIGNSRRQRQTTAGTPYPEVYYLPG